MSDVVIRPPGSGRGMLLLIVGLLVLPFVIGGGLYVSGWQPARSTHHGRLLDPPLALPDEVLRSTAEIRGKWLLLIQVSGACAAECAGRVDEMRRIQVSLNKEMGRLRRVVLTDRPNDPQLAALRSAQPDLLLVAMPPGGLAVAADSRSIADPQGRLIMSYPPKVGAREVRTDLDRLLKFAWTG